MSHTLEHAIRRLWKNKAKHLLAAVHAHGQLAAGTVGFIFARSSRASSNLMKSLLPSADEYTLCNVTVPAVLLWCVVCRRLRASASFAFPYAAQTFDVPWLSRALPVQRLQTKQQTPMASALSTLLLPGAASKPCALQAGHHPRACMLTCGARWCSRASWTPTRTSACNHRRVFSARAAAYALPPCRQRPYLRTQPQPERRFERRGCFHRC
jgi:hypothetical protein